MRSLVLVLALGLVLSACGRRGGLELPEQAQAGQKPASQAGQVPVMGLPTPGRNSPSEPDLSDPSAVSMAVPPSGAQMNRELSEALGVSSSTIRTGGVGNRTQVYQPKPPPDRPFVLDPLL